MDDALTAACRERGWINLYTMFLPEGWNLTQRGSRPEFECKSPFPGSNDHRPSFAVDSHNGYWADYHRREQLIGAPKFGGNLVMFIAYMRGSVDSRNRLYGDFQAAERELREILGLSRPIDIEWFSACRMRLASNQSQYHLGWQPYKRWSAEVLAKVEAGWDPDEERVVLPIYDRNGKLVNCKLYRVDGARRDKMVWKRSGVGPQNLPFPFQIAWSSKKPFWFVEGEGDALFLISHGIPAISGTMGSSEVPYMGMPGAEFCTGRDVVVCGDEGLVGEAYAARAVASFQPVALSVRRVRVPHWDGCSPKRDISDYGEHLYRQGKTHQEVREALIQLVDTAEIVGSEARFDAEPIEMSLTEAMEPEMFGRRFTTSIRVISKGTSSYIAPCNIDLTCRENKQYCKDCPMAGRGRAWSRTMDHRSPRLFNLTMVDDRRQYAMLKEEMHIPAPCTEVRFNVTTTYDVQVVTIGPPQTVSNLGSIAADEAHGKRAEMFVISRGNIKIEQGRDYNVRGFTYPVAKNQKAVLVVDMAEPLAKSTAGSTLTPEECARLRRTFHPPGYTTLQALERLANDMARSVTGIRGRTDLHLLYRAVWHSAVEFNLAGEYVARGWMEAFVLGDTRCGKSAAFKAMSNWLGTGVLVDCKMQTVPGLLGAVEQSSITGERYVVPGVMPLNDKRGPIGLDEFTGTKMNRTALIEAMSSTRAEGVVTISKAAHASLKARVRTIWMANPGEGRLLADIPGFGVERMRALVGQPEDVARFDAAMAVSQADVPLETLLRPVELQRPAVPMEDARLLLEWARAREPDNFVWEQDAIDTLTEAVRRMVTQYDQSIPLVEPATQRQKLAKLAVANAMSTFSSPDGRNVVVTAGHVSAAYVMYVGWYQKPAFGYDKYSARRQHDSTIVDPNAVQQLLEAELGDGIIQGLMNLERVDKFDDKMFKVMVALRMDNVNNVLRVLSLNRCIEPAGGNMYRMTRAFVRWVTEYIRNSELKPRRSKDGQRETDEASRGDGSSDGDASNVDRAGR